MRKGVGPYMNMLEALNTRVSILNLTVLNCLVTPTHACTNPNMQPWHDSFHSHPTPPRLANLCVFGASLRWSLGCSFTITFTVILIASASVPLTCAPARHLTRYMWTSELGHSQNHFESVSSNVSFFSPTRSDPSHYVILTVAWSQPSSIHTLAPSQPRARHLRAF